MKKYLAPYSLVYMVLGDRKGEKIMMATKQQWLCWISYLVKNIYPVRIINAAKNEMAADLAKD